jgi:hypothetical protein
MGQQQNDPTKKQEAEQADRKRQDKREKDRASTPEHPGNQDPQLDPSHIQED